MQMAPMIDIVFLLLIFFIVTWDSKANEREIEISLPAADEGKDPRRLIGEIIVNIKADGTIVLNGQPMTAEQLTAKLATIVANFNADQAVILRGDKLTAYDDIVRVLDACKKAKIWNVAFITKPNEELGAPPSGP